MKKVILTIILVLFSCNVGAAIPDFSISFIWDQDQIRAETGRKIDTKIRLKMPEGYYLYAEKTDLEFVALEGIQIKDVRYPEKQFKPDPLGGEPAGVYGSDSEISIEMAIPPNFEEGKYEVDAVLHYQGCSEKLCFKPSEKLISWNILVTSVVETIPKESPKVEIKDDLSNWLNLVRGKDSGTVLDIKYNWLIIIAFIGGILSSLTPCVLPLIPITLLIIGVNPGRRWSSNLGLSMLLVAGMAVTYSALGLVAAILGISLGFIFQCKLFLLFVTLFLFAMSISLLGIYTFRLPSSIATAVSRLGGRGYSGAFLAGISMGILATPCVGPVVGALLVYAGSSGSLFASFLLFISYSIGLGLIIIIAGTGYGTLVSRLKGARVIWIKKILGILILVPALYYLHSLVPYTSLFVNWAKHPIQWQSASHVLIERTEGELQPKMVLFTAEWCPPCKVMEVFTLKDADVVALSKNFVNVKVDTTSVTKENKVLIDRYGVMGWPTVVFTSPGGEAYKDLTISGGFITSGDLTKQMNKAISRSRR